MLTSALAGEGAAAAGECVCGVRGPPPRPPPRPPPPRDLRRVGVPAAGVLAGEDTAAATGECRVCVSGCKCALGTAAETCGCSCTLACALTSALAGDA